MEKLKNNRLIVITGTILISLFIIAITTIVVNVLNNNNKIKLQQMAENEKKEKETTLRRCVLDADSKRATNIKSNCQSQTQCELSIMEFLEKVYEQDLNNCYKIYN